MPQPSLCGAARGVSAAPYAARLALMLLLAPAATSAVQETPGVPVCVDTPAARHTLRAELARSPRERARGLMGRARLAPDAGMLFLYPAAQPPQRGFWMYRTRIPLDAAFIGTDGRIVTVREMTPCRAERPQDCPVYVPDSPYSAVLEVNRGWFARRAVGPGARVAICGQ